MPFVFVRSLRWPFALGAVVVVLTFASSAQSPASPSLGDLARTQRGKQQSKTVKPKKVVTNEEIPESSEAATSSDTPHNDGPHDEASVQHPAGDISKTGDAYKAEIAQRKAALADLKAQMDKLNGSIHFVEANAYRNGVEYNKRQAQKQQEAERLKSQYEEQKHDLEQMQENARKAGFGSAVWDP